MRIKKYIAKSMREALMQIKEELGEEAVILKTRKLPKKVFSIGDPNEIEVTAAVDEMAAPVNTVKMSALQVDKKDNSTGVYQRPRLSCIVDMDKPDAPEIKPWHPGKIEKKKVMDHTENIEQKEEKLQILELKENIKELRELVKKVLEKNPAASTNLDFFKGAYASLYKHLVDSEIREDLAVSYINKINDTSSAITNTNIEKKLVEFIDKEYPVSGPIKLKKDGPLIVAFVGPTGSGKTTTLAKLAAHCAINKGKSVSIITADTYRIAAIEQIRIFADIVKVGLHVIFSPDEIESAFKECAGNDIVFIDTAGRSQRDSEHMGELKNLVDGLRPDEIHLVMSATTKYTDLKDIVQRYRTVGVNRLLFTKLDETLKIGNIFNVIKDSSIPLSYLTFGQAVPDDIELAQGSRLVHRLLEGAIL